MMSHLKEDNVPAEALLSERCLWRKEKTRDERQLLLSSMYSLNDVDVLCTDKTGTLTANVLAVEALHPYGMEEAEFQLQFTSAGCLRLPHHWRRHSGVGSARPNDLAFSPL